MNRDVWMLISRPRRRLSAATNLGFHVTAEIRQQEHQISSASLFTSGVFTTCWRSRIFYTTINKGHKQLHTTPDSRTPPCWISETTERGERGVVLPTNTSDVHQVYNIYTYTHK